MASFTTRDIVAFDSTPLRIAVQKGGRFPEVHGVETSSLTGGAKSESETELLDAGKRSSVGDAGPQDLSVALRPNTGVEAYRFLQQQYLANTPVVLRIETSEKHLLRNVIAADTIAAEATADTATGFYTLEGAGDVDFTNDAQWPLGTYIVVEGSQATSAELFIIESVTDATHAEASFLGRINDGAHAAISASSKWLRLIPGDRTEALFNIIEFDGREFSANQNMGGTMTAKMVSAPTAKTYSHQWTSWTNSA